MSDYEYVNHPQHYNKAGRKECIVEMLSRWGAEATAQWCEMTAYKYEYRLGDKPGDSALQDGQKIDWYMQTAKELRDGTSKYLEQIR